MKREETNERKRRLILLAVKQLVGSEQEAPAQMTDIEKITGYSICTIKRHLDEMEKTGEVKRRKIGNVFMYRKD